jgi:hypothetical protein
VAVRNHRGHSTTRDRRRFARANLHCVNARRVFWPVGAAVPLAISACDSGPSFHSTGRVSVPTAWSLYDHEKLKSNCGSLGYVYL